MGAQEAVLKLFANAVKYFNPDPRNQNQRNLDELFDCIDDEATVYTVSGQVGYHPKSSVQEFFNNEITDNPVFTPNTPYPTPKFNATYTAASMTGDAIWTDENSPEGEPIIYTFTFVYRPSSNAWYILTMWGS
jgi:hypothetical protein